MTACLTPEAEALRLDALHRLNLLDTPPSESFDRISRMAARLFDLPIAAVSLTDHDRQWFKSRVGVDHWSIPRHRAPCAAVAEEAGVLVVPDLLANPLYADSVLAEQGVRFYAGAPLVTRDGHGLGALCVLGTQPRHATDEEIAALDDLAKMVMAQVELQHAFGRVDPVSGLPNRIQFGEDLDDLAREYGGKPRLAVVVDLAPAERISEGLRVLGPRYVDDLLTNAVPLLREALHPAVVYHVSAHQFAAVLDEHEQSEDRLGLLEKWMSGLRASSRHHRLTTAAVGALPFNLGALSPANVLRSGHAASLDARAAGVRIAIHSKASDAAHRRRFDLLSDFESALASPDQLRLVYQPRVSLSTKQCVGAEALLRWRHPTLGDVPPDEFVPILEQTAFARPMTEWVVKEAVRGLKTLERSGFAGKLSINLSAANLLEEDLVSRLDCLLSGHGIAPQNLELEVTESAALSDKEQAASRLLQLAALGVAIAIDDFGTGHSSLAYLKDLPAGTVKIDGSFVRDLDEERGRVLIASTILLLRDLGYHVVAEGVETHQQADLLRVMNCHEAQGYLFGSPTEFSDFLEEACPPLITSLGATY